MFNRHLLRRLGLVLIVLAWGISELVALWRSRWRASAQKL
jgi:hypothetical protein